MLSFQKCLTFILSNIASAPLYLLSSWDSNYMYIKRSHHVLYILYALLQRFSFFLFSFLQLGYFLLTYFFFSLQVFFAMSSMLLNSMIDYLILVILFFSYKISIFFTISFIKIEYTHYTIHSFKVYNSVVLSIFAKLCNHHYLIPEYHYHLRKEPCIH